MKQKLFFMIGLGAMMLTSCSDNEDIPQMSTTNSVTTTTNDTVSNKLQISANIDGMISSRAVDIQWEDGDAIGVYADNFASNVKFVTSGDGEFYSTEEDLYFYGPEVHHFYGWYPYYDTSDDCYSVPVNGQDANPEGQKLTDIMFAEADASFDHPNLYLIFHHKMARLIFNVKTSEDDGFYAEDIFGTAEESEIHSSYGVLYNTPLMATVWPKTGVVEGSETKGNLMLLNGTDDTENCVRQYVLLVPEQKATSYYHCFNDGDSSKITFKTKLGNKTWKAGYSYTYNITIRNTGMTVTSETVEEWIDGGVEDLDAY
jgi:hypothetical protein